MLNEKMQADFVLLQPQARERAILIAKSALDETVSAQAHLFLLERLEALCAGSLNADDSLREFRFIQKWLQSELDVRDFLALPEVISFRAKICG